MSDEKIFPILDALAAAYPEACCQLKHENPFQLLVATILSAQSTDQKVNQVTASLFREYPSPEKMLELSQAELEGRIKSIGLNKTKARNILETCRILIEKYGGKVPSILAELQQLPGVGRKTANVVLGNAFGIPAFPVDTHVFRVAKRLGIAQGKTPLEIERILTSIIPQNLWIDTHHRLIFHGRQVCSARNPQCSACTLQQYCTSKPVKN